jgi:phosphoglycerol transferase MdoB-like AlkP superfamily enzyme
MPSNKFNSLHFPVRLFVFYMIGLILWQFLFIGFNEVPEIFLPVLNGARLDTSMICGAFLVTFIPYILFLIFGFKSFMTLTKYMHFLIWIGICVVEFSSMLLYKEWGSTLDSRAISYTVHPQEAWASIKDFIPFWPTFLGLTILVSGLKRLKSLFYEWSPVRSHYFQSIVFMVLVGPLSFLGLRGGWQKLPIVPSDAFYSKDMKNNFAATNKTWYFLYSLTKSSDISTVNNSTEIEKYTLKYAEERCDAGNHHGQWKNKNIIVIIMEGWSADMVSYLYGNDVVTPFFDSISQHSLRFDHGFSTGFRTDQGLMSILSGIPSIQSVNMPNMIDKVKNYPSLVRSLKNNGRETSFIYGGDLNFSNLYNYLSTMGFDTIIRDKDFEKKDQSTAWGVPDHITVDKAIDIMDSHETRFFSTLLLLSSHAPFEVPISNKFTSLGGHVNQYKSSVRYSDLALQRFFTLAKTKPWYQESVFVITADHGSTHSGWAGMEDHNRFRIPLIFYDPKDSLSKLQHISQTPCNHFDLPATICNLAAADTSPFIFSRDMLCDDKGRNAFWNIDAVTAMYGKNEQNIFLNNATNTGRQQESVLFLDMVKNWFNRL